MLFRSNKTALEEWLKLQEEAKRRDHRKIGAEMNLFAFDADFTGPGLPLWLPKGGAVLEELEKLAKETEFQAGYVRVKTPHLARERMYKTSGHLPYYAESMFPPMEIDEDREARAELLKKRDSLLDSLNEYARSESPKRQNPEFKLHNAEQLVAQDRKSTRLNSSH